MLVNIPNCCWLVILILVALIGAQVLLKAMPGVNLLPINIKAVGIGIGGIGKIPIPVVSVSVSVHVGIGKISNR